MIDKQSVLSAMKNKRDRDFSLIVFSEVPWNWPTQFLPTCSRENPMAILIYPPVVDHRRARGNTES